MDVLGPTSPIFLRYLEAYEKNPNSQIFAALADYYRTLGMLEKAQEILKKGIALHPHYVMGHVCLGHCYFDLKQYSLAYTVLYPLIEKAPDNLTLRRLFALVCIEVGQTSQALESFKYILFIRPSDNEAKRWVKELENVGVSETSNVSIDKEKVSAFIQNDLSSSEEIIVSLKKEENFDDWKKISLVDSQVMTSGEEKEKGTLMTHTLVDMYCSQGHFDKACDILRKILSLNPDDHKTREKLKEIESFLDNTLNEDPPFVTPDFSQDSGPSSKSLSVEAKSSEEEGHQKLMDIVDKKVKSKDLEKNKLLIRKLESLHNAIQRKQKK